jgi:hypothetical protein
MEMRGGGEDEMSGMRGWNVGDEWEERRRRVE